MEATAVIRAAGLRVTRPRLAVYGVVATVGKHQEAEFIVAETRRREPTISRQAVYDNLNALVAAGILRRIEPAGRPALYEDRVGDNHHHLICRRCRLTLDVDCAAGHAPCLHPSDPQGFTLDEAEVIYWGLCPNCQAISTLEEGTQDDH
ncbi:MAG: transcriptional repressor [Fimbriimonadaceae bacterium]|nr:transcriptional repressor [Fimbriimonadaceae bacterium]